VNDDDDDNVLLGCDAVKTRKCISFQRNILLPSSGLEMVCAYKSALRHNSEDHHERSWLGNRSGLTMIGINWEDQADVGGLH
jgi:hypothetical protein